MASLKPLCRCAAGDISSGPVISNTIGCRPSVFTLSRHSIAAYSAILRPASMLSPPI